MSQLTLREINDQITDAMREVHKAECDIENAARNLYKGKLYLTEKITTRDQLIKLREKIISVSSQQKSVSEMAVGACLRDKSAV